MRAGLNLPQYEVDFADAPSRIVDVARAAEEAGFDAVWVSDHPFAIGPDGSKSGALDPLVALGHILAATDRISAGSLVLASSMRSAEEIAAAARALDTVGPGRLVLGLGTGWFVPEHRAYGVELANVAERVRALEQAAVAVREIGVPLLIGGIGRRVIDVAARRADRWNCAWDVSPDAFVTLSKMLDESCARAGRTGHAVQRTVGVTVLLADDRHAAEQAVEKVRMRAPFLRSIRLDDLERAIIVGDAQTCARRIAAYGADEVVITSLVRDDVDEVRELGERLLPLL